LNVDFFLTINKLGNDGQHETSTELASWAGRQFTEQLIICGRAAYQIPKDFASNNDIASGKNNAAK